MNSALHRGQLVSCLVQDLRQGSQKECLHASSASVAAWFLFSIQMTHSSISSSAAPSAAAAPAASPDADADAAAAPTTAVAGFVAAVAEPDDGFNTSFFPTLP